MSKEARANAEYWMHTMGHQNLLDVLDACQERAGIEKGESVSRKSDIKRSADYWANRIIHAHTSHPESTPEEIFTELGRRYGPVSTVIHAITRWERLLSNLDNGQLTFSEKRERLDQLLTAMNDLRKELTVDETENADYITLMPTVNGTRALVVIQHYDKSGDTWVQRKCSDALSLRAANALAESWSAAMKLEIR